MLMKCCENEKPKNERTNKPILKHTIQSKSTRISRLPKCDSRKSTTNVTLISTTKLQIHFHSNVVLQAQTKIPNEVKTKEKKVTIFKSS